MKFIEDYYNENFTRKVKLVTRILRGDSTSAEDVVQEAFARALRFYPTYDVERGTVDKWFNSIMFNALHDFQKDPNGVTHKAPDSLTVQDILEEIQLSNTPDLNNYILSRIEEVENQKHKRILELFFIMGYTSKEISQIEPKVSQTNVTTLVMRFREKLKARK